MMGALGAVGCGAGYDFNNVGTNLREGAKAQKKNKRKIVKTLQKMNNTRTYLALTGRELSFILFMVQAMGADGVDASGIFSPLVSLFSLVRLIRVRTAGARCRGAVWA
jgi:hypothetical protein